MTAGKFFGLFFIVHLVVSTGYYFLASLGGGSGGIGGGNVGMGVFGAMYALYGVAGGKSNIAPTVLPLLFLINSALTFGVATGIFLVVRRLRAA